tara:strand:- start:759 stop:1055 length:297 start_codon:yes stop_codon:yes gene_type:complete
MDSLFSKLSCKILLLLLFNGCVQSTAFFGPAITVASTGNIYQAGLSYGSSRAVNSLTGKTPYENIKEILQPKENENKIIRSAKKKIKKAAKIEDLSNQ